MMNNDQEGRLYDRPASERSSTNKHNAEKASMYDERQSQESFNSAVTAELDGAVARGRQEGANAVMDQVYGYAQEHQPVEHGGGSMGLLEAVEKDWGQLQGQRQEDLIRPLEHQESQYPEQAQAAEEEASNAAYERAFALADQMGGVSEDEMNELIITEMNKVGL